MHPDPEDVKREEEVREKATRNPLKLQELIEQEQERGAAEGGREAASGYTSFNLLNPGGSPSARRRRSVGELGWVGPRNRCRGPRSSRRRRSLQKGA